MKKYNRLNVGCGKDFIKGWLNISLFEDKEKFPYGQIVEINGADVLHQDIREGIKLPEASVECIYNSHFIEHLEPQEGYEFLKSCYDLLVPGGILRTTCPDLAIWIKHYVNNDLDFFRQYKETFERGNYPLNTKGLMFSVAMYQWGHKWMYDFDSLKEILRQAEFADVDRLSFQKGKIPDLKELEPKRDWRIMETLYVEAVK